MSKNKLVRDDAPVESIPYGRLDSWKEIAAYLKREVRTVQRWETAEGLPNYRHVHKKLGSVYAYKAELDAWWSNHRPRLEAEEVKPRETPRGRRGLMWAFVVALAVLLAPGMALWHYRSRAPRLPCVAARPTLRQVAVLDFPFAKPSPNGRLLAYQDAASRRIWLRDLERGGTRLLVQQGWEFVDEFVWSPDGRRLAFTSKDEEGSFQVETIEIATEARKVIWRGGLPRLVLADWSQDGKRFLCVIELPDGQRHLAFLELADGKVTPIGTLPGRSHQPQLSFDARFVSYASARENNWGVSLMRTDGSGAETRLTDRQTQGMWPVQSPDGRWTLFARQSSVSEAVWAVEIDPNSGKPARQPFPLYQLPNYSKLLATTANGALFLAHGKAAERIFLVEIDPASGAPEASTKAAVEDEAEGPAWSADGRKLCFLRPIPNSTNQVSVERDVRTGEEHVVRFPDSYVVGFVARARSGSSYAFFGWDRKGQKGMYEYRVESGKVVPLWKTSEYQNPPMSWSPDGTELLFSSAPLRDGRHPVRALKPSGGVVQTVAFSWSRPFPQWSPDGKEIAFTDGQCLMVALRQGGTPRRITCAPQTILPSFTWVALGQLAWSPDGQKLAWTVHDQDRQRVEIWIVDYHTGEHRVWPGETNYHSWPEDPQWSPDGRQIAFTMRYKPEYEIWALSNFLPK